MNETRRGFLAGAMAFAAYGLQAETAKLKNGAEYEMEALPEEMTIQVKRGGALRFLLEENRTTGYSWEATYTASECTVTIEHRTADSDALGAPGRAAITIAKNAAVETPTLIEFKYVRPWEPNAPAKKLRLIVYTIPGAVADFHYAKDNATIALLEAECRARDITLTDWHVHIRGGLTVEMAAERERACGFIRQSAMENHGREWEIFDNARLVAFAEHARKIEVNGHHLPIGIQVNDRDWFRQIDAATRAKFDYILADTMIMGKLANGRDRRLWLVRDLAEIGDPEAWMDEYVKHNLTILDEPISIFANPTYLPAPLTQLQDKLWTEARMTAIIRKAIEKGVALEIQAESPYPRPKFLRLAKDMGAKFSFGTNNFDPTPKNLSRWLEAITWLDLKKTDIWSPRG